MKDIYDVIVIGAGPAGMAAALEAKKNGARDIIIIERNKEPGGILPQCIHNGFGSVLFKEDLPGPAYAYRFIEEVYKSGIEILTDTSVLDLTSSRKIYANNTNQGYIELSGRAVVLAMGCRERTRAQIRIPGGRPAGVFTAGTVQRMVNIENMMPGSRFVILGSGDIGMIMARRLTFEGAHVKRVVEAMPFLTGLRRNYVQCLQDFDIKLDLSTTINKIIGRDRVEAVQTVKVDPSLKPLPGTEEMIECDSILMSVGLIPENELSRKAGVEMDPLTNGPRVDEVMATNIEGIYAAGNVVTIYDVADYVSLAGYTAGRNAALFAAVPKSALKIPSQILNVKAGKNVRSVIPQKLNPGNIRDSGFILELRAGRPIEKKVLVEISGGNRSIKSYRENYARPAEMITINVRPGEWDKISPEDSELLVNIKEMA